jgi:ATP-binding cassette subfamily B multidrug efflux pump
MSSIPFEQRILTTPIRSYMWKNRRRVFFGLFFLFFTNALDTLPPLIVGKSIDLIAKQAPAFEILRTVGLLLVICLGLASCRFLWRVFWGRFQHQVAEDLRCRTYSRFMDLGMSFFNRHPTGELMSLITNDVNAFRMAVGPGVLLLFDGIFLICFIPPAMATISLSWTWKTLILMPVLPFFISRLQKLILLSYKDEQERFSEMSGSAQEIVSGIRVIKGHAQEDTFTEQFNRYSRGFEGACNKVARLDSVFGPAMELSVTLGSVVLLLVGAPEVISHQITIGQFFAFYQYIERMAWPMTALGYSISQIQQGRGSFVRIANLLNALPDVISRLNHRVHRFENLKFRNVTFRFPGQKFAALTDVSFDLRAGQTMAIVGLTGSGKSTIADVLTRIYPLHEGQILLNDQPIENYALADLRKHLVYATQEASLFSEPIRDNIAATETITDQQLNQVSQWVDITDEVTSLPEGFETWLGERGVNLSGGQKQRIALARALVRAENVLILDDSLSAVDAVTERVILDHLRGSLQSQRDPSLPPLTLILISHRISTVQGADTILVMNGGRIEAQGRHQELLKTSPTYKKLHDLQRSENVAH